MRKVDIAKLNQLTHNRNASIRLYQSYRAKYQGESPEWIVEKCIEDLLRDRGVEVRNAKGPRAFRFPKVRKYQSISRPNDITKWVVLAALIGLSVFVVVNRQSNIQPETRIDPKEINPGVSE